MSTTTAGTATPVAPTRAVDVRRPSAARLTAVELRKTLDTRSGRWLLVVVALMAAAGLGWRLYNADNTPVAFDHWFGTALTPVQQLLPVLGVLAMTSEWTQRTALTTFTLVPQRGRVLAAKLVAAVVLTTAMVLLIVAVSAASTLAAGLATGDTVDWGNPPKLLVGAAASFALTMLMGAGFGALLQQTPAAMVGYFIAPALATTAAAALLGDNARWVNIYEALGRVSELDLTGAVAPTVVTLGIWITLPLVLGFVRSMRREVS
jgi:hypothetical protein